MTRASEPGNDADVDVLVVDDEPVVSGGVLLVLRGQGLRGAAAPDASSALAHPALRRCRLVVCDLMLPDRDGADLVRDMRRVRPDVPIIVMTGYATSANNERALEAGATAFLPKPFDEEELLAAVRSVLQENRP